MNLARISFLVVMILFAVGPLYTLVKISVSPPEEVMTAHPTLVPQRLTAQHWQRVIADGQLTQPLQKSLIVATGVALLALALSAPAAYSLAHVSPHWRYGMLLGLFLCRMLPEVSIALPMAVVFLRWGLMDTHLSLILSHLTLVLPITVWILTTTFSTIPRDVEEAAALDGCNAWQTLVRVMLPLALPGIAVGSLLAWLFSWEEFVLSTYLTLGEKTMPLQVYYYLYQGNWFHTAVAATVMTLPVIVISAFLQRYLQETSLSGAVR